MHLKKDGNPHSISAHHVPTIECGYYESSISSSSDNKRKYAAADELPETDLMGSEADVVLFNNFSRISSAGLPTRILCFPSVPFQPVVRSRPRLCLSHQPPHALRAASVAVRSYNTCERSKAPIRSSGRVVGRSSLFLVCRDEMDVRKSRGGFK